MDRTEHAHLQTYLMIVLENVLMTMMKMEFVMNSKYLDVQTLQHVITHPELQMIMDLVPTIAKDV